MILAALTLIIGFTLGCLFGHIRAMHHFRRAQSELEYLRRLINKIPYPNQ